MDRSKKTLFELIGGIVTLTLIELAIVTILDSVFNMDWTNNIGSVWLGGICGSLMAAGIAWHMYYTINKALQCTKDDAEPIMRHGALLRMALLFTILVLLVCNFRKYINMYMLFWGIMNLKFAAYLVPLIDKKSKKIN